MTPRRRFRFIRELAAGGFGKVYVAEMITTDNFSSVVAIKLLHGQWTTHEEIAQRARDEARLLGRLRHRNIVRVEDLTSIRGQAAVIMEYLEGVDLKSLTTFLTERGEQMPLPAIFEIVGAVASALEAAYNHVPLQGGEPLRLIHRDIKPSNVILTLGGDVKLLDFGTARANFEDREAKTQALAFGSQAYMAPERMLGDPDTPAADIFSLGVTVYEMISGAAFGKIHIRPERYARALDERMQQLNLDGQEEELQDRIRALLKAMLSYEPDVRPTAAQVMEKMEVLAEEAVGPSMRRFARLTVADAMQADAHVPEDDELSGVTLFEDRSSSFDTEGLGDATIPPPEPDEHVSISRPIPLANRGPSPLEAIRTPPPLQPARTVYPDSLPAELAEGEISEDVVRPSEPAPVPAVSEPRAIPVVSEPRPVPVVSEPRPIPVVSEPRPIPVVEAAPPEPVVEPAPEIPALDPVITPEIPVQVPEAAPPEPVQVERTPERPPEPVIRQVSRPPEPPVQFEDPPVQEKKGKGGLIAVVAVVLLLVMGGGYAALNSGDTTPDKPVTTEVKPKPPEPQVKPPEPPVKPSDPPVDPPKDPTPPVTPEVTPPVVKDPVTPPPNNTTNAASDEVGGLRLMVLPIGSAEVSLNSAMGYKKDWDGSGARLDLSGLAKGTYRTKVSPKEGGASQRGTVNVEAGQTCTYKLDLAAAQSDWQLVGCE